MTPAGIPALLEPIQERLDAATPGPWKADVSVRGDCVVWGPNGRFLMNAQAEPHWLEYPGETRMVSFDVDRRDAVFIAAAPTDTARLLAAVKAVVAESGEVVADSEGLGLDFQEDDFDRGYHAARRQTVQQILDAVEAALRGEA